MTQPRKPKGAPNSAGGQYDTYAHTTPSGLPALDRELAWERERGEGGRVEQSQQPAPPVGVTDGGGMGGWTRTCRHRYARIWWKGLGSTAIWGRSHCSSVT